MTSFNNIIYSLFTIFIINCFNVFVISLFYCYKTSICSDDKKSPFFISILNIQDDFDEKFYYAAETLVVL